MHVPPEVVTDKQRLLPWGEGKQMSRMSTTCIRLIILEILDVEKDMGKDMGGGRERERAKSR